MSGFWVTWNAWLFIGGTSYLPPQHRLQMTCVCIWVGRLNLSGIAETASSYNRLSTGVSSMSSKDKDLLSGWGKDKDLLSGWGKDKDVLSGLGKMVSCLAGRGMSRLSIIPLIGWEPLFLSSWFHLWSRFDNICQTRCWCTWKHVQRAGETWQKCQPNLQIQLRAEASQWPRSSSTEPFLTLVRLLCTFYHEIFILKVVLPSSGSWCISFKGKTISIE